MKVLVTGSAGFIGAAVSRALLDRGDTVVGIDNLNSYYSPSLKRARLLNLESDASFSFIECDIADADALEAVFARSGFDRVVHLAAQAGVRWSLDHPSVYVRSNIDGFANVLECCRRHPVAHLLYASSSSVYGNRTEAPFRESDTLNKPESLYAATKIADELLASTYSRLYGIPATGLRFFTVYGPWGRPDMAPMLFLKAIDQGRPIQVFNHGDLMRDFTFIDDIVEGVIRVLDVVPQACDGLRHTIYNIGHGAPVRLLDFITALEQAAGKKAEKVWLPMQPGDVLQTFASTEKLERDFGYRPATPLEEGLRQLVAWYRACGSDLYD